MVELNREKRGDFDSLSGVAGFLSKVAGSIARLFCQLGSVLQDPAMRKKENGDWSFKAQNREALLCSAGVSPNSPLLSQIWCTLESVPDIWLDIEPDIGWFLLVRIFNNEVSDAERLCTGKEVSLNKIATEENLWRPSACLEWQLPSLQRLLPNKIIRPNIL